MKDKNKSKIIFFVDATCDLPAAFVKEHDIQIIGLRYYISGDEGWYTVADSQSQFDEYYEKMREGEFGSTSLVLYEDAIEAFEPFFKNGYDIIHFGLSSGLAKTYENARNAGADLSKKYGCKFYAPDTHGVSAQNYFHLRQIMMLEEKYRAESNCFERIVQEFPANIGKIKAYFTVDDLKYLHKGGRLSATAALFGGMLKVKPLITTNEEGKLVNFTKKKGRLASIIFLADLTAKYIDPDYLEVIIVHADCMADAKILEQKVLKKNPNVKIEIINVGFIIGTHTGPGTLGLGFKIK